MEEASSLGEGGDCSEGGNPKKRPASRSARMWSPKLQDDGKDMQTSLMCGGICYGLRKLTAAAVVASVRYLGLFFDVRTYGSETKFQDAVINRDDNVGVITVANHASIVDDPFILSFLLKRSHFFDFHALRWGWCTAEVCFPSRSKLTDFFWLTGKIFPIYRGQGIRQIGVDQAIGHLSRGDWFHLFPEGRVAYPELWQVNDIGPLKWGVGRLIVDTYRRTGNAPKVVPLVHRGMHINLPRHEECYAIPLPRVPIRILVGDPVDVTHLLEAHIRGIESNPGWGDPFPPPDETAYERVAEAVHSAMKDLQREMDEIIIAEEGTQSPSLSNAYLYEKALSNQQQQILSTPRAGHHLQASNGATGWRPLSSLPPSFLSFFSSQKAISSSSSSPSPPAANVAATTARNDGGGAARSFTLSEAGCSEYTRDDAGQGNTEE